MKTRSSAIFIFLAFFFTASSVVSAYDVAGTVRLKPPFPAPLTITVPEDQRESCGEKKLSPRLKISPEGFVANAVIKIEGEFPGNTGNIENQTYSMDQMNCEFSPHIVLVPRGATLSIFNSEPILHNVRAFDESAKMLFNDAMPVKGLVLKKEFKDAGKFPLRCGVHKWMHAVIIVREHPYYALSDENGKFKIQDIPDGNYALTVWHESLGEKCFNVSPEKAFVTAVYESQPSVK